MKNSFLLGPARRDDDGFILLETLVAISLIAVVMAAVTTFFVGAVASTGLQRATQVATQLANSSVDTIRSLPGSDPIIGHDAISVATQFNAVPAAVAPWLSSMTAATDPKAVTGSGATAAVPTVGVAQTVNNITYSVTVYLGNCVIPAGVLTNAVCAPAAAATGIQYLRAVVAVNWTGQRCPAGQCSYVTATLLSTVDDPLFNVNQTAPSAPVLSNPGTQVSAVGDAVTLAPTVTAIATFRVAITAGALPVGLTLDTATGRITGTPSAASATAPVTLTLTDGFGRSTTVTFNWTVLPPLTGTPPAAQASLVGTAITALRLGAAGGQSPYVWTDPKGSLPPGLSMSTAGVITGTPSSTGQLPQTFPVLLTVTDAANRTDTVLLNWTISYPPFAVAVPASQNSTVGVAVSLPLTITGGSGSLTWTGGASLPAGLTLSTAGIITGAPTGAATTSVTLTATDTKALASTNPNVFASQTFTFTWTVFARPTVGSPGNQVLTTGMQTTFQLATTCPNAPCSYAVLNAPAGISINASGLVTVAITGVAQTFGNVTLTVTDKAGAVVSTAPFTLTVNAAPSFTDPGTITTPAGTATSVNFAGQVTGGTGPLTFSATGLPAGLSMSAAGVVTGTPTGSGTTTGVVLTVRDANGVADTTAAFSWVVGGPPSAPLNVKVVNGDGTTTVSWTAPANNGAAITRYTVDLDPGGGCTTTTATSCTVSGLTDGVVYAVTVTATNTYGVGPASAAINAIPYPAVLSAATLWLDGADPGVLFIGTTCTGALAAANTSVGCWKDKSSQGENFNQTVAGSQPGVGSWNGLPATNFADAGDVLNSINAADTYQTVFVAANVTNAAGSGVLVDLFGRATQDTNVRIGTGVQRDSPNTNDWSYNTGSIPLNWINGAQAVNARTPLELITSDQAASPQTFAASVSNTFYNRGIVGQIGDVITFKRVLTTAERRAVEEYLSNKWGVVITPGAPGNINAARSSQYYSAGAKVAWTAPSNTGGAPIAGYTVTSSAGQTCTTTGALTCTVTGLSSYRSYTFTVTATNSAGTGPSSAASNSVTP